MPSSKKMEFDAEVEAPAHLLYDVLANKPQSLSTISPDYIQKSGVESGKYGTVLTFHYTIDGEPKTAKEIIEKKDDENYSITWKIVDGDLLKEYKSFKMGVQATPTGTGSLVHMTFEYENNNGCSQEPHSLKEFTLHNVKNIHAYLLNAQLNHA